MMSKTAIQSKLQAGVMTYWTCMVSLALLLLGCSAQPEASSPGSCTLNCANKRVPSADLQITILGPPVKMACLGAFTPTTTVVDFSGPIELKFLATQKINDMSGSATSSGSSTSSVGGASGSYTPGSAIVSAEPVAGIGFEPWILGSLANDQTTAEFKDPTDPNKVSKFKFAGVVTPSAEWCSDSCGVMSYEIWPICAEGITTEVTASVVAGAATVAAPYQISIANTQGTTPTPTPPH